MDPFWLGADRYTSDAGDGGQSRKIARNSGKRRPYGPQQVTDTQKTPSKYNAHRLCAAPMMDWTDFIGKTAALVHRGAPDILSALILDRLLPEVQWRAINAIIGSAY